MSLEKAVQSWCVPTAKGSLWLPSRKIISFPTKNGRHTHMKSISLFQALSYKASPLVRKLCFLGISHKPTHMKSISRFQALSYKASPIVRKLFFFGNFPNRDLTSPFTHSGTLGMNILRCSSDGVRGKYYWNMVMIMCLKVIVNATNQPHKPTPPPQLDSG